MDLEVSIDWAHRFEQIDAKLDQLLKLLAKEDLMWQISNKPLTRIELEYWPNCKPDGTFDIPGFGLKLQESGYKKADTYKQLYGKIISEYDLSHFQQLPINTYLDFDWMNQQVRDLKRKHCNHHIAFFHQFYINNPGMEEVFNNFLLVVDKETLAGFVVFRCINDKPIKMNVQFERKEVNSKERYLCALSANQLKPIREKIK